MRKVKIKWPSMLLRSLQTLARCCSLRLAPKWHGVVTSLFTLLASFPSLPYQIFQNNDCALLTAWTPLLEVLLFAPLCLALRLRFDGRRRHALTALCQSRCETIRDRKRSLSAED